MLKELLQAFTGAATTSAYTNPTSNGLSVPQGTTFKNFFSTLASSFSNSPNGIFQNQLPQGFGGGVPSGSIQAYRNAQGQFGAAGQYPGYTQSGNFRAQALAPGAVVIDSTPQLPMQLPYNQGYYPNQVAALNPLQGFAGQNGSINPQPGFPPQNQFGVPLQQYAPPYGFPQQGGGGFGKLSLFILPIIGIFSLIRSLFGLRKFVSSMKPVQIDTNNIDYKNTLTSYQDFEREEGSFDNNYYPEEYENNDFGAERLQGL